MGCRWSMQKILALKKNVKKPEIENLGAYNMNTLHIVNVISYAFT